MRLTVLLGWIFALVALAAIFMPVYGGGRPISKDAACLSNLKQLGLGLIQYAADENDRFPPRDTWADASYPYVKNRDLLYDPVFFDKGEKGPYAYAFNGVLSREKEPKEPTGTPMLYDSVNPIRNASDLVTSLPFPGRHKGKDNVVYADGHARAVAKS